MSNKLLLKFLTSTEGKYFSLTINDIKADENGNPLVTDEEVNSLMDTIIEKNIFLTKYGDLTGKKSAKIVSTNSTSVALN
ncbi:hypothetical protein CLTEP_18380 [Clostridium tepidiprofundi DSM 19306]|uniref:DUF2922 domain-containing protein n=1 Tax=Clostridium tepidiprofundi DSM 19306 TaxID=1121338 RepID=A0A151B3A5_9CLOT|nr:DUF2922 domain-containing protein [Clostridium tepidiprofundi]KYH34263.1 hypothetical protein CLTEP_18380 [Clostridium tepidiprofundi DSM 19306]